MSRLKLAAVAMFAVVMAASDVSAHELITFEGIVTRVTQTTIQVRTKEGRLVTFPIKAVRQVLSGQKPTTLKAVTVGKAIIVDGDGDDIETMDATIYLTKG